jgi:hypothetical protein
MRFFANALIASCAAVPLASCVAVPAAAQVAPAHTPAERPTAAFVKADAEAAVRQLAIILEENFLFPQIGREYGAMLRANLEGGAYASFVDGRAFADRVTEDLQAVYGDGHLRVQVVPQESGSGVRAERRGPPTINAISRSGWIADGAAYIRFDGFPGNEQTMAALRIFLDEHKSAMTLIIDARNHRGGGLAEMDLMFPRLFAQPTVVVAMDTRIAAEQRAGGPPETSLRIVAGPEGVVRREHHVVPAAQSGTLQNARVYLLTSKRTASAGEHLALALKRTARATLIGETTGGAGHFGGMAPLEESGTYAAFVPVGRTFDPDTNQGWEGTGVKPDVEIAADKALTEALRLAGLNVSDEAALARLK